MENEFSVSVIVVEEEDGTFKSSCPDLGLDSSGPTSAEAMKNLSEEIKKHAREAGPGNVKLKPVRCQKVRIKV